MPGLLEAREGKRTWYLGLKTPRDAQSFTQSYILLTFSPVFQLGSQSGATSHRQEEEEFGELHLHRQDRIQMLQTARPTSSVGSFCNRGGFSLLPTNRRLWKFRLKCGNDRVQTSCAMTSHQRSVAREEGLLHVSGGLCNANASHRLWKLETFKGGA